MGIMDKADDTKKDMQDRSKDLQTDAQAKIDEIKADRRRREQSTEQSDQTTMS